MDSKLKQIFENLVPFIIIGILIAVFIALLFLFFYVAIWGLIIGSVLWLGALVKQWLFAEKVPLKDNGRIIEHRRDIQ